MRASLLMVLVCFLFAAGCQRGEVVTESPPEQPSAAAAEANDPSVTISAVDPDSYDYAEKEEIRRKYALKPGTLVKIYGINGPVTVETAETDTAEILIIRSAHKREDLQYRQISIEQTPEHLEIGREGDRRSVFSAFSTIPEGRQRAILKLPRQVDFEANGISENLTVGELKGRLKIRGVSGKVLVKRVIGETTLSGLNGEADVTFGPMVGYPIDVFGVNGEVVLRFEGEVNANLLARGNNGEIESDLPGFEKKEDEERPGRIETRIGQGGAEIEIRGVNGNVKLLKAGKQQTAASAR